MKPTSFPHQNTHRIMLFQPEVPGNDLDRIAHIAADAIGVARRAAEELALLPVPVLSSVMSAYQVLLQGIASRDVFSDRFREAASELHRHLETARIAPDHQDRRDRAQTDLHQALTWSHRVSDLLVCAQLVGQHQATG